MNKLATLLLTLVCCHLSLFSQTSIKEDFTFSTQSEIDNFQFSYPNLTEIDGDVIIEGDDIVRLNGLHMLSSIDGTLCIQKNNSLGCLAGLDNLQYVEKLIIKNNDKLVNLIGLGSLVSINGYVQIWYNDLLIDLSGFDNLSYIGSDLMIGGNYSLLNCSGLESLKNVGGSLVVGCIAGWMHHNRSLRSLAGFENVTNVGGFLWINCNDSLTTLSGLESLISVGEGLIINDNKSLINLTGLEKLKSCGGCLIVGGWGDCTGNMVLESLQGIENIDPESVCELRIRNNPILSSCAIKSVCNYIHNTDAIVEIKDNAFGCNNLQEVDAACSESSVNEESILNKLSIFPNPFTDLITLEYELKEPAIVEMMIYNRFGVEMENISEQQQGYQETTWSAKNLPPGIYFCKIKTNRGVQTKKLIKLN